MFHSSKDQKRMQLPYETSEPCLLPMPLCIILVLHSRIFIQAGISLTLSSTPPRILSQIQNRRKAGMNANGACLLPNSSSNSINKTSIEGSRHPKRLWKEGLFKGTYTMQTLPSLQKGYINPGFLCI